MKINKCPMCHKDAGELKNRGGLYFIQCQYCGSETSPCSNAQNAQDIWNDWCVLEANPAQSDPVNHPAHYTAGGVECIDAITAALTCQSDPVAAWLTGQVIKYMWRWPQKAGVEDLHKAAWYLGRLCGHVERQNGGETNGDQ